MAAQASSFATQADGPAGWAVRFGSSALSVEAGATVTTAMQVTTPPSVRTGTYAISPLVADASYSASTQALYTVTSSGAAATFTDEFNRSDSDGLGERGWTPVSDTP